MSKYIRNLRILHIAMDGGTGGSTRSLLYLAIGMRDINLPLVSKIWIGKKGPAFSEFNNIGIEPRLFSNMLSRIPQKKYNVRSLVTALPKFVSLIKFQKALARESFDVLHFNYEGLFIHALIARFSLNNAKIVIHCRNEWAENVFSKAFARLINLSADKLIAISKPVAYRMIENGIPRSKIQVLNNPCTIVNAKNIFERSDVFTLRPIVIHFYGQLDEVKQPSRLISLANLLEQKNIPFKIKIFGAPPKRRSITKNLLSEQQKLQQRETSDNLDFTFECVGHVERPLETLKNAHFVIRTSRDNDPWARDIIEAMCHGVPVIATGSFDGYIKDGISGYLIGDWNAQKVAKLIENCVDDPEHYQAMRKSAYERAAKLFDPQQQSLAFFKILQKTFFSINNRSKLGDM